MYDYVLQYGFDKEIQDYIQSIKNILKLNNVIDREELATSYNYWFIWV